MASGIQGGSSFQSAASNVVGVTADPTSALSVATAVSPTGFRFRGGELTFTHTVTNTGATTLSGLAVSQTLVGASTPSCQAATLAPGSIDHLHVERTRPLRLTPMPRRLWIPPLRPRRTRRARR